MTPLLTIAIPTRNRAPLLECSLRLLAPQIRAAGGEVELVISDNCSTDDTREVVYRAIGDTPGVVVFDPFFRFARQPRNVGVAANIFTITDHLATGEWCWLLGDDDFVRPDGVARVLNALREAQHIKGGRQIDYLFVNATCKTLSERPPLDTLDLTGMGLFPMKGLHAEPNKFGYGNNPHPVEKWEDLLTPSVDPVFLGSLACSVFRLSRFRQHGLGSLVTTEQFPTLAHTYPHAVAMARTLIGRPSYFLGYPCTVNFYGNQEWLAHIPTIFAVTLNELLDEYARCGVPQWRIDRCRWALLTSAEMLPALKAICVTGGVPRGETFSWAKFCWQNLRTWDVVLGYWREVWKLRHPRMYRALVRAGRAPRKLARMVSQLYRRPETAHPPAE